MKPSTWRKIAMAAWRPPNDPTIHGTMDVEMTRALAYIEETRSRSGTHVTVTHLVARAAALALAHTPEANVQVRWGRVCARASVDIFLQVSFEEGRELSGALLREADRKPLAELGSELASRAEAIRSKEDRQFRRNFALARWAPRFFLRAMMKIADFVSHDLGWNLPGLGMPRDPFGSAMVTSLGMYGVDAGLAPLFPHARCPVVVVVGRVADRPWVVEGRVEARPVMTIGATFDHRLIDGVQAASLARFVRDYLTDPVGVEASSVT